MNVERLKRDLSQLFYTMPLAVYTVGGGRKCSVRVDLDLYLD